MTESPDLSGLFEADPELPGARDLFGTAGPSAVGAFLRRRGWEVTETRAVQALYRPGRSCLVRYRVRTRTPAGPRVLTACAETRADRRSTAAPPDDFRERYALPDPVQEASPYLVWAFPYDPSLEGLPNAAWGPAVRELLRRAGEQPAAVSAEPVRYRPRRRAVFRYVALHRERRGIRRAVLFEKTLRRPAAQRWLARSVPGPGSRRTRLDLAVPTAADGHTLVVPALPGRSLRELLVSGGSLPSPERVAAVLDDLPGALSIANPIPARGPADALRLAGEAAFLVKRLAPQAAAGADLVTGAVSRGFERTAVQPRLVHGDLYEAQLFVGHGYRLGVIDLDGVGVGDPAMDAANFCAHLVALALSVPAAAPRLLAYRALVREAFARRLDVPMWDLAWREALAMLLLATGPFRVVHPNWPSEVGRRVDVAVRLIDPEGAS